MDFDIIFLKIPFIFMNYNYSPIILSYLSHNLFHRSDKHLTFLRRSDADTVVPVRRADQDLSLCQFIFYPHRIHFFPLLRCGILRNSEENKVCRRRDNLKSELF